MSLTVTHDPLLEADIHIVSGPHYAKNHWLQHPRVLLLDRAYWHDERREGMASMPWVSLGWLRPDGGRSFHVGRGRARPEVRVKDEGSGSIFLADYGGPIEQADTVRRHPDEQSPRESLKDALRRHRIAIGYQTTALVTAALEGLTVFCKDSRSIMSEPNWLDLLSYADWHYSEIASGEAWEHLCRY